MSCRRHLTALASATRFMAEPLERRMLLSLAPAGPEFRVNTYTTNNQFESAIAMDADGDFVVAWTSRYQDLSGFGIFAQRYDALGVARGPEFRVNSFQAGNQNNPAVAMDADGDFVVAWQSYFQDGSFDGIYAQRYNAAGVPQGGEFRANSYTTDAQDQATVAMDIAGNFVIAWRSVGQDGSAGGVYAQRFNAAGVPQGAEFRVNSYTTERQLRPAAAMDADGDFVIAWNSRGQDGSFYGVYAQRYNAAGVAQGAEFRVNSFTTGHQYNPAVAMDLSGDFVVAWNSPQDGNTYEIYAQRYNAAGVAQGSEFRVNSHTTNLQWMPAIAMDADGDFVVAWDSYAQDLSGLGIFAQRYDALGVARGPEFRVNTFTTGPQRESAIAMDADGDLIVTWHSYQDGDRYGIYAQRYIESNAEFRVNSFTTSEQRFPAIAMDADRDFVVAWQSYDQDGSNWGIFAQRYNAAGVPQGGEFRVNSFTTDSQTSPTIAMDADGDFVVAWRSYLQDGSLHGVYAQRYNAAGLPQGAEFRVNSFTTGHQENPAVAMDLSGDFVVAWNSPQDGSAQGIYAQRYNAAGVPQGGEFRVNTYTTNIQFGPAIAMDPDGDFVVAWQSYAQDLSGLGIFAQRYDAAGVPQGAEFKVNTFTPDDQSNPAMAMDHLGNFVVTWDSRFQDGEGHGIYAQRYGATGVPRGGEFRVNTYTTNIQAVPAIAMDGDGDFVVTWMSWLQDGSAWGIYAQRYNGSGVPGGGEFRGQQLHPA